MRSETNPCHLACRQRAVSLGRMWFCKTCNEKFTRIVSTNRRSIEKEQNAWCVKCRKPARRSAENFACDTCKWSAAIAPKVILKYRYLDKSRHPVCLGCHRVMIVGLKGKGWACNFCRKLCVAHRGTSSAPERNAWCLRCRNPMERHGKNFSCPPCKTAVRKQGASAGRIPARTFREASAQTTGWIYKHEGGRHLYPYCVRCKKRMHRVKQAGQVKAFKCHNCRETVQARYLLAGRRYATEQAVLTLLRAGHLNYQIEKTLHCHRATVARLRKLVPDPARCECGLLKHHSRGCKKKDDFRREAAKLQPVFESIVTQLQARLRDNVPPDMRDEIRQMMLLEIIQFADKLKDDPRQFVKQYNRLFPYNRDISLDQNPELVEVLEG